MAFKAQILLLTATITPPTGARDLKRMDPRVRLDDYCRALDFYLGLMDRGADRIIFAENSASDLSRLEAMAAERGLRERVEFISFYGLDYPPTYDRGYGELKLIDYTVEHSAFLRALRPDYTAWKVTGRYIVRNLDQIIARQPEDFDFYINFRMGLDRPLFPMKILKWTDMWLFAWSVRGYEDFLKGAYTVFADGKEDHFREVIEQAPKHLKIVPRYTVVPWIDGVRGYDSQNFMTGANRVKYYVRVVFNRVAPWVWI